jgi:hypothetical protein
LNRENEVANERIKVSDEVIEPEAVEETSDTPSSPPPVTTKTCTAGGDGDRRPKKTRQTGPLFARISSSCMTHARKCAAFRGRARTWSRTQRSSLWWPLSFSRSICSQSIAFGQFLIEHLKTLLGG